VKLGSAPSVHCPYCYEEISGQPYWFRCSGRLSQRGRKCAMAVDEVLRERFGYTAPLGPAFSVTGHPEAAECPACGGESTFRICAICHSRLPAQFGHVRSHLIVPIGAKEAGKTVFMTVLIHELMNQTGAQLNAAIAGADDATRQRFRGSYERPLFREAQMLAPTLPAAAQANPPLVFRFINENSARLARNGHAPGGRPFRTRGPQHTLLSFFDTAGEDLRSTEVMEQNVRYLQAADSIMLLLDPLQMPGARERARPGTYLPTPGGPADEPAAVLENITDLVREQNPHRSGIDAKGMITKPLAIVFTKMDALLDELSPTSPLRRIPSRANGFDEADGLAVHHEIQRLLVNWEGLPIENYAARNYRHYRYFGVSALGETPTTDNRLSPRGIRPYRVADPILWIFTHFKIIQ
jgi:hypothetical protein